MNSQSSRQEGVFGDNKVSYLLVLHKKVCCDPSSEPSHEMVQMRGHNIWF